MFNFIAFFLISILVTLGAIVLLRNRKSEINLSFSLFCFSFAVWDYFADQVTRRTMSGAIFFDKYIFFVASISLAFFLYFTFVFPERRKNLVRPWRYLLFVFPAIILLLTPFDMIIKDVEIKWDVVRPIFGAAYPVFVAFTLIFILWGFYNLLSSYFAAKGSEKLQIRYVFLGMLLSFAAMIVTNLVLPWLGEPRMATIGPLFSLFFVAFTSYAILRHRLMSIEVVIQKGFIYTLVTLIVFGLYVIAVSISELLFRNALQYSSLFVSGVAAIFIALIYQPLNRFLLNASSSIFFGGKYDYQKTLREVSHAISTKIRLEELTGLIVSTFVGTMKVSEISFLISDPEKHRFKSVQVEIAEGHSRYKRIEIDEDSHIVAWLRERKDILFLDELEKEISALESTKEGSAGKLKMLFALKEEMERLSIALWIPILSKEELIGIISLGYKLSGDIFSSEDLALLTTLSNQTAVALENSRLYEEVLSVKNYTQDILEAMVSGVITIDMRGQIGTFNPAAEKITDLDAKAVIGKNFKEIFSQKSLLSQIIESALSGRQIRNRETSIVSEKKGLVPISLNSSLLMDANGKKSGIIFSMSDLTEMKYLEGKVRQADKIGALGTMAAGMAHEIKNPLSSMKVLSQLLPLKFDDSEFRQKFIEIMPREISRIDRIVESLLGFARAATPKFTQIDLNKVIDDDVKYFSDQAKAAGVKMSATYASLPQINGDPDQLSQVFSNLILNALQAMPEGGTINIQTREGKKIENVLQTIDVEVSDTGHGISEENVKKLFDPFFTTKYAGTGLGLTIAHSIIDGHRGLIDVSSKAGKGTTFIVTLPVSQDLI